MGILDTVRRADEIAEDFGFNFWLLGPKGAGKTMLGATVADHPLGRDLLVLDNEGGSSVLSDMDHVYVEPATDWEKYSRIYMALLQEHHVFKSVMLDNMSEIVEVAKADILKKEPDLEEKDLRKMYRLINDMVTKLIRSFRNLALSKNMNVIFVSWDARERDERNGTIIYDIDLPPSLQRRASGIVDIVGYLDVRQQTQGDQQRVLYLEAASNMTAKFRRRGRLAWTIPNVIVNPTLAPVIEVMKGNVAWDEAVKKYPFIHPRDRGQ